MKLVVSVVHKEDAPVLVDALIHAGFRVTMWNTTGGFSGKANVTLFAGVEDGQVDEVVRLIQDNCQARTVRMGALPPVMESGLLYVLDTEEVQAGGAVIFVLDVEQFLKA